MHRPICLHRSTPGTLPAVCWLAIQALQQFTQAAVLASRAGPAAWQELFNSAKQLWNMCRCLVNRLPSLTVALPAVTWFHGLLPGPKVAALAAEEIDRSNTADSKAEGAGSAKGKAGGDKKGVGEKSSKGTATGGDKDKKMTGGTAVAGGKGGKGGLPVVPEAVIKQVVLPEARGPNAASTLR